MKQMSTARFKVEIDYKPRAIANSTCVFHGWQSNPEGRLSIAVTVFVEKKYEPDAKDIWLTV